jgi:hypothetical protein
MEEVSNFCPAMAVPITVKIPEPITAPMPRAVSETGPRVLLSLRSGSSQSVISLSMDLQAKSWLPREAPLQVEMKSAKTTMPNESPPRCATMLPRDVAGFSLALRSAASQLLRFWLLRPAWIVTRLQRLLGLGFLARRALGLLACILFQLLCIRHSPLVVQ